MFGLIWPFVMFGFIYPSAMDPESERYYECLKKIKENKSDFFVISKNDLKMIEDYGRNKTNTDYFQRHLHLISCGTVFFFSSIILIFSFMKIENKKSNKLASGNGETAVPEP
jgi:hypothetical protein